MSLEPCRECGTSVATGAKTCPKCGAKKPHASPAEVKLDEDTKSVGGCGCTLILLPLFGAIFLLVVLVVLFLIELIFG